MTLSTLGRVIGCSQKVASSPCWQRLLCGPRLMHGFEHHKANAENHFHLATTMQGVEKVAAWDALQEASKRYRAAEAVEQACQTAASRVTQLTAAVSQQRAALTAAERDHEQHDSKHAACTARVQELVAELDRLQARMAALRALEGQGAAAQKRWLERRHAGEADPSLLPEDDSQGHQGTGE